LRQVMRLLLLTFCGRSPTITILGLDAGFIRV
jgi:hypothetical protein